MSLRERIATLSPEKAALLVQRNPLSFSQRRLWFLDQLEPGDPSYNVPLAVRLDGPLAAGTLARALTEIVRRHHVLRTAFPAVEGQPLQVVLPPAPVPLPVIDLRGLPVAARQAEADRLAEQEARRPFDLAEGSPLRVTLLALETRSHVGLITLHHIVTDGWSFEILVREMGSLYAAGGAAVLPELPVQYADFSRWQQLWLAGPELGRLLGYWRQRLAGLPPALELPADLPRPAKPAFRGSSVASQIAPEETGRLRAFARAEGATLFMTLLAAFTALLGRYTGERDIAVGSPMINRNRVELEGLIGLFHNTLVLRADLSGDPDLRELLGRVRETTLSAHDHQDLPFERLVDELQPERALNRHPLFQVMFTVKPPRRQPAELAGLRITPIGVDKGAAKFDLTLSVTDRGDRLSLDLEYSTDLFLAPTAARLLAHYETFLREAVTDPERQITELQLLGEAERHQILHGWNDASPSLDQGSCVHELFEAQARQRPDAWAVSCEEERLTYGELDRRANRLARLLARRGAGPEVRVGLCLERSVEMVVAALAVLKTGGAYLPLDPAFPPGRLALMLEDADAAFVLTSGELLTGLAGEAGAQTVLRLDLERGAVERESGEPLPATAGPDHLAYLIYTSGSTGRPKGVEVPHRGVASFLRFMARELGVTGGDTLLAVTTLSFDIAVLEVFLPLAVGARVELARRETVVEGEVLAARLAAVGATLMQATPATWQLLLDAGWAGDPGLRILCGGEALPPALARELQERSAALWNVYGPTETTIWSTLERVRGSGAITLGRPIAGTAVHLLGAAAEPAPVGIAGELCIGGVGVVRGYHGQPALTAERFVPDLFSQDPGRRLYRTGDLARRGADGRIEFLGRVDHQVKVRGFRIEPGEVEARLREHPAVREVVVAVRRGEKGPAVLVAWLAPREGAQPAPGELRAFLRQEFPDYMVPSGFVLLPALPRTPNGKVDRPSLPAPERLAPAAGSAASRTPVEEVVAGVWSEVLGLPEVGTRDNFFDLGGHSLLATQIVSRLRGLLRVDLPLRRLFEGPTVGELAACIEAAGREGEGLRVPPIERVARDGDLPLSYPQQRLWFLSQLEPGNPFYNLTVAVRLSGRLEGPALAAALDEVVRRHEALRTVFPTRDGKPVQQILPALSARLPVVDLAALPAGERELSRLLQLQSRQPFELAEGPLLRVLLLRPAEQEHVIVITLHHIVGDRWSLGLFVSEVVALYRSLAEGAPAQLPELTVQYADFAHWQRRWLQGEVLERQLAYWRRSLAGCPDLLRLPTDRPRPPVQTYQGARHSTVLPATLREALRALGRAEGATLFMVLFAVFQVLLRSWTKQDDIVVGANVANRTHRETEGLIGFFANLLPLRIQLRDDPSFRALLGRVREVSLGAYAHQEVPFERVVEELKPKRDLSYSPLVQVIFSFQNVPMAPPASGELRMTPLRSDSGTSKMDLTLDLVETAGGLACTLEYKRDLFRAATMARLADSYRELLAAVVARPDLSVSALAEGLAASESEKLRMQAKQLENQDALMLRDIRKRPRQPAQAS